MASTFVPTGAIRDTGQSLGSHTDSSWDPAATGAGRRHDAEGGLCGQAAQLHGYPHDPRQCSASA